MSAKAEPLQSADLAAEVARLERELSDARLEIARLEGLAHEDDLTGTLNRRGFQREMKRAIAHARRYGGGLALIMADVDGLKRINDHHGHAAGDDLIRSVAKALLSQVRASDTVARVGGDEFAVLLWNIDESQARLKASRLQTAADMSMGLPQDVAENRGYRSGSRSSRPRIPRRRFRCAPTRISISTRCGGRISR